MRKRQVTITKGLEVKCDASNQFDRFDALFRKVISVPKAAIDREEVKFRRRKTKANTRHS
jgi:hypothetical protein